MSKLLSIIIPIYNVEKYIKECVDSVLQQKFDDYEIIMVDDGSTDDSGKICDEYSKHYSSIIRVIHKTNGGLISARRAGLKIAEADYICFLDSDDKLANNTLKRISDIICTNKIDLMIFKWKKFDEQHPQGYEIMPAVFPNSGYIEKRVFFSTLLTTDSLNSLCLKCCRRSLFDIDEDYSQYKSPNGEDLIQSLPLIEKANTIYYLNEDLYLYRYNEKSISNVYRPCQYQVLNVVRPLVYSYMCKMKYDTPENVKAFYMFYLESIWFNLTLMYSGLRENSVLKQALLEIKEYQHVEKAKKYISDWNPHAYKKIGIKMFYKQKYTLFSYYMRMYNLLRRLSSKREK